MRPGLFLWPRDRNKRSIPAKCYQQIEFQNVPSASGSGWFSSSDMMET